MVAKFRQRLRDRGYPAAFLQPILDTVKRTDRQRYLQQPITDSTTGSPAPVLVFCNGQYERLRMHLGVVVNRVYEQYKHDVPALAALFGDRVVVAYSNPPSLGKQLVRAMH